ncbi:MAG: carboxypeptidase-like regulatory domain-containing protein, partial [Gemmatimonadota bacterium]
MKRAPWPFVLVAALATNVSPAGGQEVAGVLREADTDRPIAFGDVVVLDEGGAVVASVVSDAAGDFSVHLDRPGTFVLHASRLGYYAAVSTPLEVREGKRVRVTIRLVLNPLAVDSLSVDVRRPPTLLETEGFYTRMRRSQGTFLTRRDILELRGVDDIPSLLRTVTGVSVRSDVFGKEHVLLRHGRGLCAPTLIFDGTVIRPPWEDLVDIENLEGLEIYPRPSQVPGRFSVSGACGVVVAWSR